MKKVHEVPSHGDKKCVYVWLALLNFTSCIDYEVSGANGCHVDWYHGGQDCLDRIEIITEMDCHKP